MELSAENPCKSRLIDTAYAKNADILLGSSKDKKCTYFSIFVTLPNIKGENLHEYFQYLLKEYPDVMETSMISEVTGYRVAAVNRWCSKRLTKEPFLTTN